MVKTNGMKKKIIDRAFDQKRRPLEAVIKRPGTKKYIRYLTFDQLPIEILPKQFLSVWVDKDAWPVGAVKDAGDHLEVKTTGKIQKTLELPKDTVFRLWL